MKWCERCGGPVRSARHDPEGYSYKGCRLCGLEFVSRGMHAMGHGMDWALAWRNWRTNRREANSPCPHASGWWLPDGARLPFFDPMTPDQEQRFDEVLLSDWLMYHARREVMAHRIGWIAGGYRTR